MKKKISFYKKKSFYIVLIVIFSVLLVADIAIGLFAPSANMGFGNGDFSQMPGGMEFGDMEFPGGMDFGDMEFPGGMDFGDMEFPEDMDFGDMEFPGGGSSGDRPSMGGGFSGEGMPSFDDMPSMGGGSFSGGMQQGGGRPSSNGWIQTIKNNWVIIALVLVVLDDLSIYMLLRIKKEEKKNGKAGGKGQQTPMLELKDAPKEYPKFIKPMTAKWEKFAEKVNLPKYTDKVAIAVLLILVIMVGVIGTAGDSIEQVKASVYSGVVEKGEIVKYVSGTGTLTDEVAESVTLPDSVEITEWFVSNGDVVTEGQKIAQVDKVSVMSAIAEIQEKLVKLDNELEGKEEVSIADDIKANTDGKVKVIYAQSGESVVDVMYEHGALMLVSLDGMMAVSIETEEELHAGDQVSVVTEDGASLGGKVQSVTNGKVVITVSDDAAGYAEKVTLSTEEGVVLGTSELYIYNELKITGYAGTVSSVNVSVDANVEKGDVLLTLSNTEYKAEYETLLLERRELEFMMKNLVKVYQEGYIYADIAGIIKGIGQSVDSVATDTATVTSGSNLEFMNGSQQLGNSTQQGMQNQQGSTYVVSTTSFVSIVPENTLTIPVTVDEMDILSVAVGQTAEITLDAFPGQAFEGSVSSVDYNGTNSGGSTKYTVHLTMERKEDMLDGMNAAVSIEVDKTEGVLLIPVDAIVEDENGVYVYTEYNEKKESFGSLVEVTTGVSDGTYVEILSGLEEDNEYWYSSLDAVKGVTP